MEKFKNIKGYEGLYQVSNSGNVKSLARSIINKRGNTQVYPEKLLKFDEYEMSNTSYRRVSLSKGHKVSRYLVHRLVAEAFIPNTEGKPFVNHKDNNGTNNTISNLEWCTHSENMIHAEIQGRLKASQSKGGRNSGVSGERAKQRALDLIGTKVFLWQVDSFYGRKGVNNKYYVNCTCTGCGKSRPVEVSSLVNNKTKGCTGCARKIKDEDIV